MRAKESNTTVLSDFLSVPKIIGIGPIKMAPPPLILPFLDPETETRITAMMIISIPMKISVMPKVYRVAESINFSRANLKSGWRF